MMGCDGVSLPARSHSLLGMQASCMLSADTRIAPNGYVLGSLPYVEGFVGFNASNAKEQEGYYLPIVLDMTGSTMTIKKNGKAAKNKQNIPFDPEIILRVESNETTFEIEVDGKSVVKLDFRKTKMLGK